jgi:hypothetical protein
VGGGIITKLKIIIFPKFEKIVILYIIMYIYIYVLTIVVMIYVISSAKKP